MSSGASRTAYQAVAGAVELPAVGQVSTAWHHQQRALVRPGAAQQLLLREALYLRTKAGDFRQAQLEGDNTDHTINQALAQATCEEHSAAPARPSARLWRSLHTRKLSVGVSALGGGPAGVGLSRLERGAPVRPAAGPHAGSPRRSARSGCRRRRSRTPARAASCRQKRSRCFGGATAVCRRSEERRPQRGTPCRSLASERRV